MTVFYRKYRPQKLSEIFGQEHVTKTLLAQLESGRISHGYLFSGPRGTGKTSTARILAKAVNCKKVDSSQLTVNSGKKSVNREPITVNRFGEPCNKCESCLAIANGSHLDLIEIDAASNRGIDEIRDLREKIKLSPVSGRFKVYIIDEAHMLTHEAFNALLKTLEEPPAHAIFILCTTEQQKLPPTIISRLTRFNFKRAKDVDLSLAIEKIAKAEELKIDTDATFAIATASDGSYRDAISILDQLSASSKEISRSDVIKIIKTSGFERIYSFVDNLAAKNLKELVNIIEQLVQDGGDITLFNRELVIFLKKLLFIKIGTGDQFEDLEDPEKVEKLASKLAFDEIQSLMKLFLLAEGEMKFYPLSQIPLILAVCKYCGEPATIKDSEMRVENNDNKKIATTENTEKKTENTEKIAITDDIEKPGGHPRGEVKTSPGKHPGGESGSDTKTKPRLSKGVAKSSKSLGSIESHWGEFLAKVKPINSHVVALLRSSRPSELFDDKLVIEVFYRFHKEKLEEPKIISILEKMLSEIMGRKMILKFVLANRSAVPTREVAMSDVVEIDQEEISKLAHEIFSK